MRAGDLCKGIKIHLLKEDVHDLTRAKAKRYRYVCVCHLLLRYLYKSPTLQLCLLQEIFLLLIVVAVRSLTFTLLICPHCHFHCNYIGSI